MNNVKLLNDFYNTYNSDMFLANFENVVQQGLESQEDKEKSLAAIKELFEDELKVFESLKSQLPNISNLFDLPTRLGLSSQIDTVIGDLKNTQDAIMAFASGKISGDEMEKSMASLGDSFDVFTDIYAKAYKQFGETLYFAFKTNSITLKDLEEMKNQENMAPEQVKDIEKVMERIKIELGPMHVYDVNMAEQTAIEDEKGKNTSNTVENVQPVAKQPLPVESISQRVNNVEYQSGVNYADAVTEVRLQAELDKLEVQINSLKDKEKLTFSEAIQLQTLIKQSLALESVAFKQSRQQISRENKMASLDSRITDQQERLEQERQNTSKSKLFRYMSARKQQKLEEKLKELESKMATIKTEQRTSALVKFDKTNNKLARKAKMEATKQVIMTTTKENVEKLKAFGNRVVIRGKEIITEGKNVASDVGRFVRNNALVQKLKDQIIIMQGQPARLELPMDEETLVQHM